MLHAPLTGRLRAFCLLGAIAAAAVAGPAVSAAAQPRHAAQLLLPERVVPAVSSAARGGIRLELSADGRAIRYELDYASLEGEIRGVQLRFGQPEATGGILVWLCGSSIHPGPSGTPACPQAPGRLEGELGAEQVVGPAEQGVFPGQFPALLDALAQGLVYAQVESSRFDAGELRGQLRLSAAGTDLALAR